MDLLNACIFMISCREHLLERCLDLLYKNFIKQYNYPILIYYHPNTLSNKIISKFTNNENFKIKFICIERFVPDIEEKDFFYNKTELNFVKKHFPKENIGYLQANYFWNNFMHFEELKKFDFTLRIDDDSFFIKQIDFDIFRKFNDTNYNFGTGWTWNYNDQNVKDTRMNLFEFTKDFCKKYDIIPESNFLKNAIEENDVDVFKRKNIEWNCGNCNFYKMDVFKNDNFKLWNKEFNDFAGGYKYRWGDIEIFEIYCLLFDEKGFYDFKLIKNNYFIHTKFLNKVDKKIREINNK